MTYPATNPALPLICEKTYTLFPGGINIVQAILYLALYYVDGRVDGQAHLDRKRPRFMLAQIFRRLSAKVVCPTQLAR
jgi:hypothetical protein